MTKTPSAFPLAGIPLTTSGIASYSLTWDMMPTNQAWGFLSAHQASKRMKKASCDRGCLGFLAAQGSRINLGRADMGMRLAKNPTGTRYTPTPTVGMPVCMPMRTERPALPTTAVDPNGAPAPPTHRTIQPRSSVGTANACFLDGHVASLKEAPREIFAQREVLNQGDLYLFSSALIALMLFGSKHSLISKILYIISATGCILINLQQARVTLGSYGVERSHRAQASVGW